MSSLKEKIGIRLRKLRKGCDLKQHELAEKTGVDPRTISRIEVGGNYPSFELLEKLSQVLGCEIKDFFEFEGEKASNSCIKLDKEEIKALLLIAEKASKIN